MLSRRNFIKTGILAAVASVSGLSYNTTEAYTQTPVYRHSLMRNFGEYTHSRPDWKKLRDGLYFSRINIYSDGKPVESAALVLAEPGRNSFRVHHNGTSPKTIEAWQRLTGDDVMFNSSYYRYELGKGGVISSVEPATRIIIGGKPKGGFVREKPCGMLLAEPRDGKPPHMYLADLTTENIDISRYTEGVQSWPMLLANDGRIRVAPSKWYANRTAVASDNNENIVVFTTEGGYFSLHELGRFFKEGRLGVKKAMNMDGGYEADLAVDCGPVSYVTYGQWETQGDTPDKDISVPGARIKLPVVIGIRERQKSGDRGRRPIA